MCVCVCVEGGWCVRLAGLHTCMYVSKQDMTEQNTVYTLPITMYRSFYILSNYYLTDIQIWSCFIIFRQTLLVFVNS